jgi:CHAT domain-containing protein
MTWTKAHAFVAVGALLATSCAQDLSQQCRTQFDEERYEQAQTTCQRSYEQEQDAESLVMAAGAAGERGEFELAQTLAEQVSGTSFEARIYRRLARIAWRNGEMDVSHAWFARSAEVFGVAGDDAGLASALHSLYVFAWQTSDHRRALGLANDSLQAALRADNADAQAVALSDLYIVFQELGSLGPAELALELVGEKLADTRTFNHANYYLYRGALQLMLERYGMAAHEFDQALSAISGRERPLFLRSLHLNLVKSNIMLGRHDVAREHLAVAKDHAERDGSARFALAYYSARLNLLERKPQIARDALLSALDSPDLPASWVWELHFWAGQAARALGETAEARASFERSIVALEAERERLAYADMKAHLQNDRREPYEALFGLLAEQGDASGALNVIEQANARTFIDAFVAESQGALVSTDARIPVDEVAARVDAIRAYVDAMHRSPTAGTQPIDKLLLATREDAVLSYFFAEQGLWVVRVMGGAPSLHDLGVTRVQFASLLDDYRRDPDDKDVLARLGAALLPPELLPPAGQRLLIAPDRELGQIGFASLRVAQRYLVERNTPVMIPSINALVAMRASRTPDVVTAPNLVLADPRGDLPDARQEAHDVARLLATEALIGSQAGLAQLAQVQTARVLHIATHSGLGHLGPWIALAEGEVAASELAGLPLSPSLVVLASCLSGAGDQAGLWGSLGGVFLSSGAGSALVALWSIPDTATREFIQAFYSAYVEQPNAATALAQAQRAAIAADLAPRLWAGFLLLGGVDGV